MGSQTKFTIPIRIYYEDTDFSGIVYHANYLKYFERGRTEALRTCGLSHTDLLAREEPLAFVIRKMSIDWAVPARIDDVLEVCTKFVSVRGARMVLSQQIYRSDDQIAHAEVEAVCMAISGQPRRVPPDVLKLIGRVE